MVLTRKELLMSKLVVAIVAGMLVALFSALSASRSG